MAKKKEKSVNALFLREDIVLESIEVPMKTKLILPDSVKEEKMFDNYKDYPHQGRIVAMSEGASLLLKDKARVGSVVGVKMTGSYHPYKEDDVEYKVASVYDVLCVLEY